MGLIIAACLLVAPWVCAGAGVLAGTNAYKEEKLKKVGVGFRCSTSQQTVGRPLLVQAKSPFTFLGMR